MAEKKKTPLQEAIAYIEETYPTTLKRSGEVRDIMEHLKSLLPKEKEFAKEMWDAGNDVGGYYAISMDSEVNPKYPFFEELYKQYEP